jgi:NADH-quinone oxidoreductase subunit H
MPTTTIILIGVVTLLPLLYLAYAALLYMEQRLWACWQSNTSPSALWPLIAPAKAMLKPAHSRLPWICQLAPVWTFAVTVSAFGLLAQVGGSPVLLWFFVLWWLALAGLPIYGWGLHNAFSWQETTRIATQGISYTVPAIIALAGPVMLSGGPRLEDLTLAQRTSVPFIVYQPLGLCIVAVALLMAGERQPWQLPGAHDRLLASFQMQHMGVDAALFHWSEYATMILAGGLIAHGYLGGPWGPGSDGLHWLVLKTALAAPLLLWVRDRWLWLSTPELRSRLWFWLVLLALLNLVITAVLLVGR